MFAAALKGSIKNTPSESSYSVQKRIIQLRAKQINVCINPVTRNGRMDPPFKGGPSVRFLDDVRPRILPTSNSRHAHKRDEGETA